MGNALVSIVIPFFNSAEYLAAAVESALAQSWPSIELVLVDDGSTDESLAIARTYASTATVLSQPNRGACAARNLGFRHARGEYIQFLDADDLLHPAKIERQMERIEGRSAIVANGQWLRFFSGESLGAETQFHTSRNIQRDMAPVDWLLCNEMSQTGCWLTPAGLVEQAGLWDESLRINQDGEFFARVLLKAEQVVFCPDSIVYYRSGLQNSITGDRYSEPKLESLFRTCTSLERHLLAVQNSPATRRLCANTYRYFQHICYPNRADLVGAAEERIAHLGGADLEIEASVKFRALSKLIGWRAAKRLQAWSRKRRVSSAAALSHPDRRPETVSRHPAEPR